jgi:hypothetical protein
VPIFVLVNVTVDLTSGLFSGLVFGLLGGVVHGMNDVTKHLVIRLLLWLQRDVPIRYARFLDYAADCALLRKVGGGYAFSHRLLLEHFAGKFDD